MKNRVVESANLALWEFWTSASSCEPRWVDIREAGDFDPNTVTWNTQPARGGILANANVAFGRPGCPANWVNFNMTGWAQTFADGRNGRPNVMPLAVTVGDERDSLTWKRFNSGNAAGNVPIMTFTYNGACDFYNGHNVCGAIRDKWWALGGPSSYVGMPTSSEFPVPGGAASLFERGAIYWSPATGAHNVQGSIFQIWAGLGYERSFLGFPTSDEYVVASGARSDFQGGQITWDSATNTTLWTAGPSGFAGQPGWATDRTYRLSDTTTASVNVGTGNLILSIAGLTVPGVGGDRGIGVVYNSLHSAAGSVDPGGLLGAGFRLTESPDVRLVAYPDASVRYIDPSGRAAVFEWNAPAGRYDSPVGDGGRAMARDGSNNWVLTTLASNRRQTFRAADGLLVSDSDRNGVAYTFGYDGAGKPTTITGTRGGAAVGFTIGGAGVPAGYLGRMSQTIDGVTRTVVFGYNGSGRLTSILDASGQTTSLGWTGTDITTITPPSGKPTAVSYDTGHRVTQVARDVGSGGFNATTRIAYTTNAAGLAEQRVTDPNNHATTYRVDALGKVTAATDALGHTQATTYSPNNDVATAVDALPGANTTTYSYSDAAGGYTPTGIRIPTGASATATYPSTGSGPLRYLPTSARDPQRNVTTVDYDTVGNPTRQVTGGVTTSTTYNPPTGQPAVCAGGGRPGQVCTSTDGRGNTTTYTYDTAGNLRTVTPPPGVIKRTAFTYDAAGRPKTVTDGDNRVTTYVYDGQDRVTQIRYNGATTCAVAADCQVYTYDPNGNLIDRVDAAGRTRYLYDALNRLIRQQMPPVSIIGGVSVVSTSYDLAGNSLSFTDGSGPTRYGYDAGNNLISLAPPGGSCTGVVSGCITYTYNANGVRTAINYPGGTVAQMQSIDASGRAFKYFARAGDGTVVMNFDYSYNDGSGDSGVVRGRRDNLVPGGAIQRYSYDGLNRLTRALEKVGINPTASWSYCFDANGNRTYDSTSTAAVIACPDQTNGPAPTYTYDATNALTGRAGQPANAFAYDGNGAETAAIGVKTRTGGTWNPRGQLTALTSNGAAATFAYAGEGNKERVALNNDRFQNTPLGITARTYNGGTPQYAIREPNGTIIALRTATTTHYLITDRQGSTISLVDATGLPTNTYSYDPYGNTRTRSEAVNNPYQYIGAPLDPTGLYHLQHRYYDPTLGRFTQPDPSGQEPNPYLYGLANPCTYSDPSGLITCGQIAAVIGLVSLGLAIATLPAAAVAAGATSAILSALAVSNSTALLLGGQSVILGIVSANLGIICS